MICRIWRGWTTSENASRYEAVVRAEVIPGIEARAIPGLLSIDLLRRAVPDGAEFATIMWFTDLDAVRAFVGDDYEAAHVPQPAREVLSRFDERSSHYEVLDRREQHVQASSPDLVRVPRGSGVIAAPASAPLGSSPHALRAAARDQLRAVGRAGASLSRLLADSSKRMLWSGGE